MSGPPGASPSSAVMQPTREAETSAAHTPGPWTYIPPQPYDGDDGDLEGSFYTAGSIEGADGNPVCMFGDYRGSGSMFENPVNPLLIAAAPELLHAAIRVRARAQSMRLDADASAALDDLCAAIAKAVGISEPAGSAHEARCTPAPEEQQ